MRSNHRCRHRLRSDRNRDFRRATAVAEFAICLPVLVVITLATVEACSMLYLQQKLETTAFEGARVGCVPEADVVNVRYQCETLLDSRGVKDYTIEMDPADPTTLAQGDYFTVTITAPCRENSLAGGWFYGGRNLTGDVALTKE